MALEVCRNILTYNLGSLGRYPEAVDNATVVLQHAAPSGLVSARQLHIVRIAVDYYYAMKTTTRRT